MAKIKQYENPIAGIQASETGVRSAARTAYSANQILSRAGSAVAQVGALEARQAASTVRGVGAVGLAYADHEEITRGAEATSAYIAKKTKEWDQIVNNSDPNDPTVAAKFMEGMNSDLEKLNGSMLTENSQRWMERHTEAIRNHFTNSTASSMSIVAGAAARTNAIKTVNNYSNAAVNDPAGVESYMELAKHAIEGAFSSPNLKGAAGVKAKAEFTQQAMQKIVQSAAMAAIQKSSNPEATAATWSGRFPEYINGSETLTLAKAARTQIKFNEQMARSARIQQKQLEQKKADEFGVQLMRSIIGPNGTFQPVGPEYFKALDDAVMPGEKHLPGLTTVMMERLIKFGQAESAVKVSDPGVKSALQEKLYSGELDPIDLVKAVNDEKLSHVDFGILEGQRKLIAEHPITDPTYKAVMGAVRERLIDKSMFNDTIGTGNYAVFMQRFLPEYLKLRRDDKLETNALDFNDPNSLVRKMVAPFLLSASEKVKMIKEQNAADKLAGEKPPIEGEKPPIEGARKAPNGIWHVEIGGKYFKVVK